MDEATVVSLLQKLQGMNPNTACRVHSCTRMFHILNYSAYFDKVWYWRVSTKSHLANYVWFLFV
jgi:hypothetical protein